MARIWQRNRNYIFPHRPFSGRGVSIYAGVPPLNYRNMRIIQRKIFLRGGDTFPVGETNITKTSRIGFATGVAGEAITPAVDLSQFNGQTIAVDIRHFADDVENESVHPQIVTLDVSGESVTEILGTAIELVHEVRAAGVVKIRFRWVPSDDGIQPDLFRIQRTAGPSSPADVTKAIRITDSGRGVYEILTPTLSDSSAYTYKIIAENTAGTVTKDLLTGIIITADATGPIAPVSLTIEAT